MAALLSWCTKADQNVKKIHSLRTLNADPAKRHDGIESIAKLVPTHYASEERLAHLLRRLGKPQAAQFIRAKQPTGKSIRSDELGEILTTSHVQNMTPYDITINRLPWKDHRDMAMRGDDVIGISKPNPPISVEFLKGEVNSRAAITAAIIAKAREALRRNKSRPSAHALAFLADRLHEQGQKDLVDLIDEAQLRLGIKLSQVSHLIFTFSGNYAGPQLPSDLNSYKGGVRQRAVGLIAIGAYMKVIKSGVKR